MFSQIEQIFSHIIRTRFAVSFILMLALPMAAKAQIEPVVTINASPTSIMEGNTARFIISAVPAPTSNLRVNIEVRSGVIPDNYTRPTTIIVGTSGQATLTVPTRDFTEDPDDENWGSVGVRIKEGTGYTIGHWGHASVHVIDDEANENPPATVSPLPVVTLHADRTRAAVGDVVKLIIKRTTPYDKRHRVDFRVGGHLADITEWQPMVTILHENGGTFHSPGERSYSIRVRPENNCVRTQGRRIEAFLLDAYYYGDNLGINPYDAAYKVGDPSSITIDVYYPSNRQPTGAPTIDYSGSLDVGTILTADASNIQDADGLNNVSYTYQWYRVIGGSATQIANATRSMYTVVEADNGYALKVRVAFTDNLCTPEISDSALTPAVGGADAQVTPVATITANPTTITEGASARFTITMTPAPTTSLNVDVNVSETGNFISTPTPDETVTFNANQRTATLTVNTENDQVDELNGEVRAQLQSSTAYTTGSPSSATVTVNDNDNPRMTIEAGTSPVTEGTPATFTITADPAPATSLTVNVNVTENRNFISDPPGTRTVNFSASQTTATLTVATDDDNIDELDGQIRAQLQSATDYTTGSPSSATVTVNDNDTSPPGTPSVTITAGTSPVTEGTAATFTLTASPIPTSPITVNVNATQTGNVISGTPPSTVTIGTSGTATLTVNTVNDNTDEANGSVTARLQGGTGYTVGSPASATVTVNDNDTGSPPPPPPPPPPPSPPQNPAVTISAGTSPVTEGAAASFTLTASPTPTSPITVDVNVTQTGNVISGTPDATVTIGTSGQATLTVATDDDNVAEEAGLVTAQVQAGTGYTVGTPSSASVTVNDNDGPGTKGPPLPEMTITANRASITEGTAATFTITADPVPTTALKVRVNVTQTGKVLSGTPQSTITFNAKQTTVTLTVATDDDNADEVASEVTAQLQSGTGYTVGTPSSASVTVNDNDIPRMIITANTTPVTEGTAATFTIRANPVPATALTVNVNVTQTGDILSGTPPSTVSFNANQSTATLTVATDDDDMRETAGTVMAQVTAGVGYTVGTPSSASVTVNDNDTPPNHPATGAPIIIGKPELRETLTADVSNIRDANGLTNVTYAYQWIRVMGSMEADIAGATGSTYEVATDDSGYQLKVRVNFTDDLGYPEELESALTAMVVIPGVTPVITITADPPSVTEGTAATFTITATPAPTITLTVKVNVTETANTLSGTPPLTVTINANQTTLTVATDNDKKDEHASVVTAQVRAGMGYVVGTPSSARVLVLDDDLPPAIDATLSSLTIDPGMLNPAFAPATLSYTATVPHATTTITVTAIPNNPDATVSINGQNATTSDLPFTGDTMDITVTVTAVDNITQLTYTITVTRAPAGLPQVTIKASPTSVTEGTPATFTITAYPPSLTALTVNVNVTETAKTLSGTPPSTVTISAGHITTTLTVATEDDDIDEHASMVKAKLQAGTGYEVGDPSSASVIVMDDEVTISKDATLSSLTINPGALNPTFDPETLSYTASVPHATITVTAIPNDAGATVSINGQNATTLDVPFTGDTMDIAVTVTAEDNTTQLTYTITVTRDAPSTDATLNSLTINPGTLNPTFDPSTLDYTVSVENGISTISVTAIGNNAGATITINGQNATTLDVSLVEGENTITVIVTAEDNSTQLIYTITVTRAAPVPQVTISASTTTITEGTAATFTITATPAPTTAITVSVSVTQTEDVLDGTPPSTTTINANETTATLTVATNDDNVDEEASAITALLQTGTGYTVGDPSSASVTVNDNDAAPNSPATGAPIIIGTPEVGQTLTADVSNIQDADGLENVAYTYQWIRVMGGVETEIPNATSSTYEVATADIGHQIKVRVNFTDDLGHPEELESELTAIVITPVVPVLTISASASVTEGTAATFTITATPAPTTALTVNVNITQTGNVLSGTPASTISFNASQTTATLTAATDDDNVDEEPSAVTAALQTGTGYTVGDPSSASVTVEDNDVPPNSPATGVPIIIGTPEVGQTLTADVSNIQDADGLENVAYTYQWIRVLGGAETEIIGAAGTTYEVATADIDHQLKIRVNFTDDAGQAEELESALTASVVAPEEPVPAKLDAWLARFGRVASDHVIATVRERARGHVGTDHVIIGGYNLDQMNYDGLFYNPPWMPDPFQMRYGGNASENERRKELIRQIVSSTSFARSGKFGGPYSEPRWAVWGRGAVTRFSGTDDGQTVEGDVTSVMLGIDYGDNCFQSGLVLSYSIGDGILGSIANLRDEWSVETTLTGLYPWARLSVTNRLSIWGLLGYAGGDLPLSLEGVREIETGANMTMGAIGVRSDLVGSSWHDGFSLALASDAVISRAHSDALTDFRAYTGSASRVRVLLEGSHVLWICGGSLHPLAELGIRYDGGDVDTGLGIEIGGGMRYVLTSLGLMIEGRARGLIAHQDGNYKEWGGSGTIRLSPKPSGQGLSMRVSPTWGNASGSARALWSRPDMSDIASGRSTGLYSSNPVSAEVAYGMPVFGDKLMATPFVGLQGDYKRLGLGLHRGSLFGVAVEGLQNNRDLALRVRAGMRTHHVILRLEGSLDTYGHQAYFRLQRDM